LEITRDQVQRIARLAGLGIAEEETQGYAGQLSRILDYVERMAEVEAEEPAPGRDRAAPASGLREDVIEPGLDRATVLRQAPESARGLFRVDAVLPAPAPGGSE
jgi:aspartyl-tRNA(Asn)/glutamyl-tRNA(Gln) amidotransferase subunit C